MVASRRVFVTLILILLITEHFVKESDGFIGGIRRARVARRNRRRRRRRSNFKHNQKYREEMWSQQLHMKLD
jgi:rhamnogalacturonyl hydrolase YesR